MPLVTTTEMFKKAYNGGYAIGAFNVNNMEIVQGITEACNELKGQICRIAADLLGCAPENTVFEGDHVQRSSCLCEPYIPCKISRSSSN